MKNDVWSRTKILLVPSTYESYGMVAVEALASGIPVIASPTFGLKESLSYAGIFADRSDLDAWEMHIRRLLNDDGTYAAQSSLSVKRSVELDPEVELENVTRHIEGLVNTWHTPQRQTLKPVLVVS
jgi:glycosyltransferase involved in cell wall biosynthesis